MALIEFPPEDKFSNQNVMISVLTNFDKFAKQIQTQRSGRTSFELKNETDVQDALHAILKLFYSDIRPENYVPEYAGGKSRVDFFLPEIQSVIEVKYAQESLKDNEIGKQLLIDIGRYSNIPNCKNLFLFIFDPSKILKNPAGLTSDLEKRSTPEMKIKAIVSPN